VLSDGSSTHSGVHETLFQAVTVPPKRGGLVSESSVESSDHQQQRVFHISGNLKPSSSKDESKTSARKPSKVHLLVHFIDGVKSFFTLTENTIRKETSF